MLGTILLFLVTVAIGLRVLSWILRSRRPPRRLRPPAGGADEIEIPIESGIDEHMPSLLRDESWRDPFARPGRS